MKTIEERRKRERELYQRNRESILKRKRNYYKNNKGKMLEIAKRYRNKDRDKLNKYRRGWHWKNRERVLKGKRKYYNKNKKELRKKSKEYHKNTKYYQKNKERIKKYQKEFGIKNRKKLNKKKQEYCKKNPNYKISKIIGGKIGQSLKSKKSGKPWENLVGYTLKDLMQHLEKQFKPRMNWKNHGSYWHMDHRIPVSHFKFDSYNDEDFKKCWSLENLQPLKAITNLKKNNKYSEPTLKKWI